MHSIGQQRQENIVVYVDGGLFLRTVLRLFYVGFGEPEHEAVQFFAEFAVHGD
jgi:hypothetical protein